MQVFDLLGHRLEAHLVSQQGRDVLPVVRVELVAQDVDLLVHHGLRERLLDRAKLVDVIEHEVESAYP